MKHFKWMRRDFAAKVPAKQFGQWLESLPDQNPETIVDHASDARSPAHALFLWDDKRAGPEYRLQQARMILRCFVIETVVARRGKPAKTVTAPFVTRIARGRYEITTRAMRNTGKRDFILREALRELASLRSRYAALSELAVVFSAIDQVRQSLDRRASA